MKSTGGLVNITSMLNTDKLHVGDTHKSKSTVDDDSGRKHTFATLQDGNETPTCYIHIYQVLEFVRHSSRSSVPYSAMTLNSSNDWSFVQFHRLVLTRKMTAMVKKRREKKSIVRGLKTNCLRRLFGRSRVSGHFPNSPSLPCVQWQMIVSTSWCCSRVSWLGLDQEQPGALTLSPFILSFFLLFFLLTQPCQARQALGICWRWG